MARADYGEPLGQHFAQIDEDLHPLELDHGLSDAGHGVSFTVWYLDAELTKPGGIYWWHGCPDLADYAGGDRPGGATWPPWELISPNPLTMGGSLLCTECGRHGFIRNGRWEPA
jgi:hypothetical protein